MSNEFPPLTQEPIRHVDGTPNDGYVLRILKAYRENCDCRWSETTSGDVPTNPLIVEMNRLCDERARLLDEVIERLSR